MSYLCPVWAENNENLSTASAAVRVDNVKHSIAVKNWNPVINAIMQVESNGNARAKSGTSVGILQITPVLVKDCNKILRKRGSRKRFRLADRLNRTKSREMFMLIQSHYNPKSDLERAIRLWNGGIHYTVKGTQRYFDKVMGLIKTV